MTFDCIQYTKYGYGIEVVLRYESSNVAVEAHKYE
jgi:hypothetical protein